MKKTLMQRNVFSFFTYGRYLHDFFFFRININEMRHTIYADFLCECGHIGGYRVCGYDRGGF